MKIKTLLLLLILGNISLAQKPLPINQFQQFYLGMDEQEFAEMINDNDKYTVDITHEKTIVYRNSHQLADNNRVDVVKTIDHNIQENRYDLIGLNYQLSKTVFNAGVFVFRNGYLIKILLKADGTIKEKDALEVSKTLFGNYVKGAVTRQRNPDKKAVSFSDKYSGYRKIYSHPARKGRYIDGYSLSYSYLTKPAKNTVNASYIRFEDCGQIDYWDEYITMGEDFRKKGFKAYRSFRDAFLGMSFSEFTKKFNGVKELPVIANDKYPVIKYTKMYTATIEKPTLADIPVSNMFYFFYQQRLVCILCVMDENITAIKESKFIDDLQTVYGKYNSLDTDDKVSPVWRYKTDGIDVQFSYSKQNKFLIFALESVGSKILKLDKKKTKNELMNDF